MIQTYRLSSENYQQIEGSLSFSNDFLQENEYAIYFGTDNVGHIYPDGSITLQSGCYSVSDLLDIINYTSRISYEK